MNPPRIVIPKVTKRPKNKVFLSCSGITMSYFEYYSISNIDNRISSGNF